MGQRGIRALRGTIAAAVSTFIAATSHGLADGHPPSFFAVSVAVTASVFVCIALAGKTLSRSRLALAVALSQLAYHGMFAFAPSGGTVDSRGIGAHAQHLAGPIELTAGGVAHVHGTGMWLAHVAAAIVTTIALAKGEQVVRGLLATLRLAVAALCEAPAPVMIPPVASMIPDAVASRRASAVVPSCSERGPPALALA
ncbi:hypothetical protein [Paramicrobacterium agarici]|uniref:Uncharacterized protein n=1 Tax=Paramicrobacterium agarici TaxID=630514 RepID=A0A2A9DWY8_9MICO|nr:hypothetical protein [Microbacterium agarici]PFG30419.1 hypothetical protein ATJ78_1348 [Microbacterium agarici]